MQLEIVWRNPSPPPKTKSQVELVVADEFGAVYAVVDQTRRVSFDLLLGGAA